MSLIEHCVYIYLVGIPWSISLLFTQDYMLVCTVYSLDYNPMYTVQYNPPYNYTLYTITLCTGRGW